MRAAGLALLLLLASAAASASLPAPGPLMVPCADLAGLPALRCGPANGGFEACPGCMPESGALPVGWVPYVHPAGCLHLATWTDRAAHSGASSVALDDLAGVCTGIASEPFPVIPALRYRTSAWTQGEPTARSTIYIVWYADAADPLQDYIHKTGRRAFVSADWQEQVVFDVAPEATAARVWVYGDQSSAGRFYVDDAHVTIAPDQLGLP